MIEGILLSLVKPLVRRTAVRCLEGQPRSLSRPEDGRITSAEARELFRTSWTNYQHTSGFLPRGPTIGSRLNVRLASLTLEMVRALEARGYARDHATGLTNLIAWKLYRSGAGIPKAWGRLVGRTRSTRLLHMVRAFLRFPFSKPGYVWQVDRVDDVVHLNVFKCPVADFFLVENAGDVCVNTWCTLDYPLAEYWGGSYERTGTLAAGDSACEMRWIPDGRGARTAHNA